MTKLLRAEWYKAVRRPYFLNTLAICFLCGLGVAGLLGWLKRASSPAPEQVNLPLAVFGILFSMSVGMYLVVIGADMAFSDQYKLGTLKNEVSFGLPRWSSYLARWATAALFLLLMLAVLAGSYLLSCLLLLGIPGDEVCLAQFGQSASGALSTALGTLGYFILVSLPLWLAGLSMVLCLMFLLPSTTTATMAYVFSLIALPPLLERLGLYINPLFTVLYRLLPTYPFSKLTAAQASLDWAFAGRSWALGLGWTIAATLLGLFLFRRREIK